MFCLTNKMQRGDRKGPEAGVRKRGKNMSIPIMEEQQRKGKRELHQ